MVAFEDETWVSLYPKVQAEWMERGHQRRIVTSHPVRQEAQGAEEGGTLRGPRSVPQDEEREEIHPGPPS
jgi:hypothetical protein